MTNGRFNWAPKNKMNMYVIKLVSNAFGIDDKSPIYPTQEQARKIGLLMLSLYHGRVRVEIYQILDLQTHKRRLVETMGSQE